MIPIVVSLFLVPLYFDLSFIYAFTQGKEILFKFLMIVGLFIVALTLLVKKNWRSFSWSLMGVLVFLQMVVFIVTDFMSDTPLVALFGTYSRGFGLVIQLFLFFWCFYTAFFVSKKNILFALKSFFVSGLFVALYALLQRLGLEFFFANFDTNIFDGRVYSFLGNPSYLGQLMLLYFLVSAYLFVGQKGRWRMWAAIGAAVFLVVLFLSGTRAALLGLLFSVGILCLKFRKDIGRFLSKRLVAVLVLLMLLCSLFVGVFLKDRFSFSDVALRSLRSRMEIWSGAADLIKDKLFFGYGEETFYIYFPEIVTKKFFTLEEDISLNADRLHNESLELLFSHGVFALGLYLFLGGLLLRMFFQTKDKMEAFLALVVLANMVQNQFGFPDISISIFNYFCLGGLIALGYGFRKKEQIHFGNFVRGALIVFVLFMVVVASVFTLYRPYKSQLAYMESKSNYSVNYDVAVNKHKEALEYTPYYSELWYELMFIDPSSEKRALENLEKIDGNSGNVLAWKGNMYAEEDPEKAAEFYIQALEKNPYHPNWIRAFADMLYEQGDYENALYLYNQYLDAVPDFWRWGLTLSSHSKQEQTSYRAFMKNAPYFRGTLKKINDLLENL